MEFRTKNLFIRHWKESDYRDLYHHAKDPEVGRCAGWKPHSSEEESLEVIRNILMQEECYAVCHNGKVIGCVELYDHTRSNMGISEGEYEVGGWVGRDYWGTGIFIEAAVVTFDHAFDDLHAKRLIFPMYEEVKYPQKMAILSGMTIISTDGCPELCSSEIRPGVVFELLPESWRKAKASNNH